MPLVGFEPTISAGKRPKAYALLHLVGCLYCCINDARSYKYQINNVSMKLVRLEYKPLIMVKDNND